MTSAPTMLRRGAALTIAALGLICCTAIPACVSSHRRLVVPATLLAPYSPPAERLFVVAPLRNESGTSVVDPIMVSDRLVEQLTQVDGISALPMNRTIGAMRAMGLGSIDTPAQAMALARVLKADAVVVGSITSWDPYEPLQLGLNLGIFSESPSMLPDMASDVSADDLMAFRKARTDSPVGPGHTQTPLSTISVILDADNGDVLADIKRYAAGRVDEQSAMGWEIYTRSMARYTEFSCFRSVELLLKAEQRRLAVPGADKQASTR